MKRLALAMVALGGLTFAAPAMADHDYYPRYHRHRSYYNRYDYGYSGYHPRSHYRPYRSYYRPYYGGHYRRGYHHGYYPRRGFSYYGPGFSFSLGR